MERELKMLKAIFFDVGQVLVSIAKPFEQAIDIFTPHDREAFWELLNERCLPLCRGETTLPKFWAGIAEELKKEVADEILNSLWLEGYEEATRVHEDTLRLARGLRSHYRVGIISNTIHEHALINRRQKIYDGFDPVVLSHEVQLTKENPAIFRLALGRAGVPAEQALFIDDVPRFAEVARSLGMRALVYKNHRQLEEDLKALGVAGV